jgi:hypothetical protein
VLNEQFGGVLPQFRQEADAIAGRMIQINGIKEQIKAEEKNKVIRYLSLTSPQLVKRHALAMTRDQKVRPLLKRIEALNRHLREVLAQSRPDVNTVGSLVIQVNGFMRDAKAAKDAYIEAFKGILTEDQIKKLDNVLKVERFGDGLIWD